MPSSSVLAEKRSISGASRAPQSCAITPQTITRICSSLSSFSSLALSTSSAASRFAFSSAAWADAFSAAAALSRALRLLRLSIDLRFSLRDSSFDTWYRLDEYALFRSRALSRTQLGA